MAQYIDKDRIEEILRQLWKKDDQSNPEHRICYNKALQEVQCKLDTLEMKDVDLEKEANEAWDYIFSLGWDENSHMTLKHNEYMAFAKHFFELGLKATKGE